ncbi:MAG: hypothetical protein HYX47_12065 [Burkholderiales bacterium]|nr:hypothetical protein [Burkholderiales bacterium]
MPAAPSPLGLSPTAPYHVVPDFIPEALSLRAAFESHFAQPESHGSDHQVWNYWHVPDSYTYLKTLPEKVLSRPLANAFVANVAAYARRMLGMDVVTWPYLSLYVEGCGQTLHNDSRNGAFGFVYSLTRWDDRRFKGGETLLFREQDYWASGRFRDAGAGTSFYECIPSRFNQLLVFDDRLIHGVSEVRGVADPREGRIVLHGHLRVSGPFADGPLADEMPMLLQGDLGRALGSAQLAAQSVAGQFHGFATCAVDVQEDGTVAAVQPLVQRVLGRTGPMAHVELLVDLHDALRRMRFPSREAPSRISLPVIFE